ncbi:MAG: hypothetical protein Q9157_002044 [Trypethelium eluteriae]
MQALADNILVGIWNQSEHKKQPANMIVNRATDYNPGGNLGSCGWPSNDDHYVVALSPSQDSRAHCGQHVWLKNVGGGDGGANEGVSRVIDATVIDTCPRYGYGDIDIAEGPAWDLHGPGLHEDGVFTVECNAKFDKDRYNVDSVASPGHDVDMYNLNPVDDNVSSYGTKVAGLAIGAKPSVGWENAINIKIWCGNDANERAPASQLPKAIGDIKTAGRASLEYSLISDDVQAEVPTMSGALPSASEDVLAAIANVPDRPDHLLNHDELVQKLIYRLDTPTRYKEQIQQLTQTQSRAAETEQGRAQIEECYGHLQALCLKHFGRAKTGMM